MDDEQSKAAWETGRRFQRELGELLERYLVSPDARAQTSVLGVMLAEATRGACMSGIPLETALTAVRTMYADYEKRANEPKP